MSDPLPDAPPATATRSSSSGSIKLDKGSVAEILRQGIYVASGFIHNVLARTEDEQAAGVWLADDGDQKQIGDPLAAVAARHGVPVDGGADVADLIAAGLGAVAYVSKNAAAAWKIRRGRRRLAAADPITETGDQA